jgi:hypothetical protein
MQVKTESIRFLGAEAAKVEGQTRLTPTDGCPPTIKRFTGLLVKQDGRWRISWVREEQDRSMSHSDLLKPLEWLVGDWVDESGDSVVHTHCDWSKDKKFLIREFSIHVQGQPGMTVTERIGWDPLGRQIKSWVFDSEGGYGEGFWAQENGIWVVKSRGVLPDGRVAAATHAINRVSDHAYRWTALDRMVGGRLMVQNEQATMVRTPPGPPPTPRTDRRVGP